MRIRLVWPALVVLLSAPVEAADITEVADAADGDNLIDINIDVSLHSSLNRSKITHEWAKNWYTDTTRSDYAELWAQQRIYTMEYKLTVGLFHDFEFYLTLPWVIEDKRSISFVAGKTANPAGSNPSNLYVQGGDQNALAQNPADNPKTTRKGIGDMHLGLRWAIFNSERDSTKAVWVLGVDYQIPTGSLALPQQIADGSAGGVGLGHHIVTPSILFSYRHDILDPYVGFYANLPTQGQRAKDNGLTLPYSGGFLTGLEIIPWEKGDKSQKIAFDLRLWTTFYGEVESKGLEKSRGTVTELSDFLACDPDLGTSCSRQLQAQGQYTQFGVNLGISYRMSHYVKFRCGVGLAHNTEHFITGADACLDGNKDGLCKEDKEDTDIMNRFRNPIYDDAGKRIRAEETTLFSWWLMAMATF